MNIFDGLKYRGRSIQCRPCTIPQVIATDLEKKGASRKEQSDQPATASAVPSVQEDTQGGTADAPRTTEAAAARFEEQVEKDGSIPMEVVHCKSDVCIGEQADVDDARTTDVVDTRIDEQAEVDDAITTEVLHRKPDLSIEEQAMVNDAVTTESVDCTPRARVEDDPT
ncbi:unnamed protein product [Prorocentrum cordatum]|uniref:Uncharacterized protein n=1 Tax=Prorocentrum cordatum TaxID=2364126 RepID=A0ABN9XRN5_9DINO|nr:unnamed protein product [Polarella glacialis]